MTETETLVVRTNTWADDPSSGFPGPLPNYL